MKSDKISLNENHKRSLTSTLIIVEKLIVEIEDLMTSQYKTCCFEIKRDIDSKIINQNLIVIEEARKHICNLAEKYDTGKKFQSMQRVIDAKRSKIWEILHDTKSRKMKGYGEFPQKLVKEFDKDIDELMAIASKIQY